MIGTPFVKKISESMVAMVYYLSTVHPLLCLLLFILNIIGFLGNFHNYPKDIGIMIPIISFSWIGWENNLGIINGKIGTILQVRLSYKMEEEVYWKNTIMHLPKL